MPVSYTHLDVYKRQPFIRPRDVLQSQAGQSAEDKQQSLQAAIQVHYRKVFEAVSYTHLDVYKRQ